MSPETVAQDQVDTWSSLKTVTTFDLGSTQPVGGLDSDLIVQKIKPVSATSLLVESLISQLCKFLERDPTLQKKIYDEICHKLHHMNLIDKTYGVEEFEFMRNHYQKALFHLLSVARTTTTGYSNVQKIVPALPGLNLDVIPHFQKHSPWDWSRYHTEFDELEFIDKGGFGRVFKARNKLDGEEYAVKKIYLRYRNVNSFLNSLREVKMLAKLNHQNIVSYKAAWLEPLDYVPLSGKRKRNQQNKTIRTVVIDPSSNEEDSSGIIFKNSDADNIDSDKENISSSVINKLNNIKSSNGIAQKSRSEVFIHPTQKKHICNEDDSKKSSSCFNSDMSETNTSGNSAVVSNSKVLCKFSCVVRESQDKWNNETVLPVSEHEWATLYIQMQLCDQTLRKWLNDKNAQGNFFINPVKCLRVFQQIVNGVNYIHSKGIVHHDIKPSNIFVNADLTQIQVGDFGLACCLQHSTDDFVTLMSHGCSSRSSDHKGQIGTKLYAAPEQLRGKCDPKSDIYSLGIVLFELLQPFSTEMERYKVINQLKAGQMPPDLVARVPKLTQLISEVMDLCPKNRPSAQDILEKLDVLIGDLSQNIENQDNTVLPKDELIKQLLEIISKQTKEIEELKTKVKNLEIEAKKTTG